MKRKVSLPSWCTTFVSDLLCNYSNRRPLAQLQVSSGQSIRDRSLAGLAIHILISVSVSGDCRLIHPLRQILTDPQSMSVSHCTSWVVFSTDLLPFISILCMFSNNI